MGKIREDAGDKAQALANYQRSLQYDNRQPQVASRLSTLQGSAVGSSAGSATAVAAPSVDLGTRMATRDPGPVQ